MSQDLVTEDGLPPETALGDARDWFSERVIDGVTCPCCMRFAFIYPRYLTFPISRVLIRMWKKERDGWVHLPSIRSKGQDEAIARHWGLIEPYPNARREDGSPRVGWWRLTPLGVSFVHDQVRIPKYAWIYNNRLLHLDSTTTVSIIDTLGTQFNYREMMDGPEDNA